MVLSGSALSLCRVSSLVEEAMMKGCFSWKVDPEEGFKSHRALVEKEERGARMINLECIGVVKKPNYMESEGRYIRVGLRVENLEKG